MSAGFPVDKPTVDQRAGSLAWQLRETFDNIGLFQTWLGETDDETLGALGYEAEDITLLRASFTDLDKLRQIAHAQATQPAANDFFFNAGKLTGVQ